MYRSPNSPSSSEISSLISEQVIIGTGLLSDSEEPDDAHTKSFDSSKSSLSDLTMQMRSIDINKSPKRNAVIGNASQTVTGRKRKLENYELPQVGELFDICVLMASNPSYFVVQPHQDALRLRQLMSDLQSYCATNNEFLTSDVLEVGEVYAAMHSDDNSWYRATVINIFGSTMIHVFFCDYGDVKVLSCDNLKILPAIFRDLPRQAIRAKLHGKITILVHN